MKKIGNVLKGIVISVWLVMAIFVTICLLSYNDFKVSTFGKYSLIIMDSDEMEPEYLEGDSNAKKMALLVLSSNPKYQAIFEAYACSPGKSVYNAYSRPYSSGFV